MRVRGCIGIVLIACAALASQARASILPFTPTTTEIRWDLPSNVGFQATGNAILDDATRTLTLPVTQVISASAVLNRVLHRNSSVIITIPEGVMSPSRVFRL